LWHFPGLKARVIIIVENILFYFLIPFYLLITPPFRAEAIVTFFAGFSPKLISFGASSKTKKHEYLRGKNRAQFPFAGEGVPGGRGSGSVKGRRHPALRAPLCQRGILDFCMKFHKHTL